MGPNYIIQITVAALFKAGRNPTINRTMDVLTNKQRFISDVIKNKSFKYSYQVKK